MHPLTHLVPALADAVVTAVWEAAVLALLVAACLRILPALSAAARSILWTGTFLVATALPLLAALRTATLRTAALRPGTWRSDELHLNSGWAYAVVVLWALLALVRASQLLQSALHLRGIVRRAEPLVSAPRFASILKLTQRSPAIQLCSSPEIAVPSVVGFAPPRILLPASLLGRITDADLESILLHEMEHLRRHDHWTNLLQKLALCLLPVSPALFWIERRLCLERELACDDGVVQATGAGKAYAACLVNLAEQTLLTRTVSLALGAWQHRPELARRVFRILHKPEPTLGRRRTNSIVAAALCSTLVIAIELGHLPQLVDFRSQPSPNALGSMSAEVDLTPPSTHQPEASAHLRRASMQIPHNAPDTALRNHIPHRAVAPTLRFTEIAGKQTPSQASRARVVLLGFRPALDTRRMRLVVAQDSPAQSLPFVYAAVPVRNGWLLVEL